MQTMTTSSRRQECIYNPDLDGPHTDRMLKVLERALEQSTRVEHICRILGTTTSPRTTTR